MTGGFAIIPDGYQQPSALFADLEAAMDWGIETYGGGAFRITWVDVMPVEQEDGARPAREQQD
jgi:hypothetical protein